MKNELQFTGEVIEIFPIQTINSADGTKSWQKQEVLVKEFDEKYPQSITLEVFGADKIQPIFSQFSVGNRVTFWLNIRANAFNKKDGSRGSSSANGIWKCVKQSMNQTYAAAPVQQQAQQQPVQSAPVDENGLPF